MKNFIGLTKRNLLVYFKDIQSVAFSLLTSIIVLGLYLLFLKGQFADSMKEIINSFEGLSALVSSKDVDMFANLVLLTGILGSAMITVPYNCLTTVVRDRENKIDYDILATPIKRGSIILSYFVSAASASVIMNSIILTVGLLLIRLQGSLYLGTGRVFAAYGILALGSVSATSLFLIIVLFFKNTGASGAFFGILSAASGFVIGAYVPISSFSDKIQTICNLFPASHVTILMRNILMNGILDDMDGKINKVDNGMFVSSLKEVFTFKALLFNRQFEMEEMLIYVIIGIVVCIFIQVSLYKKTYKKNN